MKTPTTRPAKRSAPFWALFATQSLLVLIVLVSCAESFGNHRWLPLLDLILAGALFVISAALGLAMMRALHAANPGHQRQQILIRELDHRVKNNLAAVVALAKQSVAKATSPEQFYQDFLGRIQALANAHTALARTHWEGVDMMELARLALEPYMHGDSNRVTLDGPALRLSPAAAGPLSMSLHELATNAAKFGGLSNTTGRVDTRWTIDADRRVALTWTESGGPPATPPTRSGMGLDLIRGFISYELEGQVQFDFLPTGLVCIMTFKSPAPSNPDQSTP